MSTTIQINIDDKACVGCSLCADVCPTKVFEFNEQERLPKVAKPGECFGCQSCAEICPSMAISHENLRLAESYYHDPNALAMVEKLGKPFRTFNVPEEARVKVAIDDLGVRLLSVASVLRQTLGQSLPAVGTMAGISLATQLPRYQPPANLDDALKLMSQIFAPAWEVSSSLAGEELTVTVKTCFVRNVCQRAKLELGGDLCTLFYNYLAGYLSRTGGVRPRFVKAVRGAGECVYTIKLMGMK